MFLVKNSRPTDQHGSRSYTCPFLLWSDRFCAESRRCGNIQAARNIHTGFNEQCYHLGLILEPKDLSKKWGCTEQRMQRLKGRFKFQRFQDPLTTIYLEKG